MLKNVGKCWKMLNVENITKNVEMLKNVGTKINFFYGNNFIFDKEFKTIIINFYFYQHLFSALYTSIYIYIYIYIYVRERN